jgi:5-methylcytosine-specific restriction endonuclease McrA
MPFVSIKDILYFSSNNGVILKPGALKVSAEELQETVHRAFMHMDDYYLVEACCGGRGPLAGYFEITYEQYLDLLKKIEIEEAGKEAKQHHTKIRRASYDASRSRLVLAMIDAGFPYVCAQSGCTVHVDLTVDHIVPLSRGGSDELINLRFLCLQHNSSKRDKLILEGSDYGKD